jgi:two-component system, chemotaxis family, CheB/CheR fusion protein
VEERAPVATGIKEARHVAITGYGQEADQERARDAGFDAHLTKPLEFDELETVMASLLLRPLSLAN